MKCSKCHYSLIDEELENHICRKAKGFRIDGDLIWISDGVMEYPLKLNKVKEKLRSTDNLHKKNQPQNGQSLKTITL